MIEWKRSSFCEAGACLEIALEPDAVYLKDSKTGVILHLTRQEWGAFRAGLEAGEFEDDRPLHP